MGPVAPPIPTTRLVEEVLSKLEGLSYWGRRMFVKHRMPGQYPRFLYKYCGLDPDNLTSVDRLRDLVVRSQFWLSDHERFNDPFDLKAKIIFVGTQEQKRKRLKVLIANQSGAPRKERRERLEQMMKRPDAEMEAGLNEIFQKRSKGIGVCSFAGNARSILMWSHYGSTHAGVCLQFETVLSPRTFTLAHLVEYEKEYPQINFLTDFEDQLLIPMLRKHKGWEYEGEWRILHLAGANAYLSFDAQSLRRLVIGCRASPSVYSCIDTLLHERYEKNLPKVRILRATQHSSEYKLQVSRVPDLPKS